MTTTKVQMARMSSSPITFEDLKGLRAAYYVRDSKLDQRDGAGLEIQLHNIQRFAQTYGLILVDWYTEFVSARSVKKRGAFRQILDDARVIPS